MNLTPPYLEQDYDDSDGPSKFDVPGIDDCDHLYVLTSRDGNTSVYIRVHENLGAFFAAVSLDAENFACDILSESGPFDTPEHACADNLQIAREWFKGNSLGFVYCSESRKIARRGRLK